jgi:hypothetical protein
VVEGAEGAVGSLIEYAHTRDEGDYRRYVPRSPSRWAIDARRIELEKPDPDLTVAREGFLAGVLSDDIEGMIDALPPISPREFHGEGDRDLDRQR